MENIVSKNKNLLETMRSNFDVKNYELKEDEYLKNGVVYCKKCNTPRMASHKDHTFYSKCKCQDEEIEREREKERALKVQQYYNQLKLNSMQTVRFAQVSFDKTDLDRPADFINAHERCQTYVERWETINPTGLGIYLCGDVGTGKTRLTACVGNALMQQKYVPVIFTTIIDILKELKTVMNVSNKTTDTEQALMYKLSQVDLLIIDDLGTEKLSTWSQEKIFDLINSRYNKKKCTIFSSNYDLEQLLKRGFEQRTIDRIAEMSHAKIRLQGDSYRLKINKENENLF